MSAPASIAFVGTASLVLGVLALSVSARAGADLADEKVLAQRYAPVVRLVEQSHECGPGEPYQPMDVDALFGQPTVALRARGNQPTSLRSARARTSSSACTSTTSTSAGARSTRAAATSAGRG